MKPILLKSRVKQHQRRLKGGAVTTVREHETSQAKKQAADRKYLMAVARTIRNQIGGGALYMIGAKGFGAGLSGEGEPYLQFRIGRNSKGVNHIRITLNHLDTYDVEFGRTVKGPRYVKVSEEHGIYNDMLRGAIERGTGMATSLGTMGKSNVKAHQRRIKSGIVVNVREHTDSRNPRGKAQVMTTSGSESIPEKTEKKKVKKWETISKLYGIKVPENREDLLKVIAEWDENWHDEKEELAVNASVRAWVKSVSEKAVIEMLKHPQVTMYGPPNRMSIYKYLKFARLISKSLIDKYPLLQKAVGRVKAHQRHLKSGKVVPVREYDMSHVTGSQLVTTHLKLKGRGITQLGDGSDHARGLNTYRITDAAFKKVQQRHGEFHYRNKGESLTPDEGRRKRAILAEKNAASQRKWINSVLANDEGSTDAELIAHLRDEGQMSQAEAKHYVAQRSKVLSDPMYSTLKPYRGGRAIKPTGPAAVTTVNLPTIWKYDIGSAGSYYLTTDIDLKGVGIRLHSTNLHGEKIYRLSDLAFEKLKAKYGPPQFTKSMENGSMDTLEKYPLLAKAIGNVKQHQRRTKSGKMVTVREHQKTVKPGQRGFESAHIKQGTNYFAEMALHHRRRMEHHDERMKQHKEGSAKYSHHYYRSSVHEGDWEMNRDEAGLSTKEERGKNSDKARKKDAAIFAAAGHKGAHKSKQITYGKKVRKSMESEPMDTINLNEFPLLAKAIKRGSLSKSLEFTKSGNEIYMAIMAKIGGLQGELLLAVAQWQAGLKPSPTSVSEGMDAEATEVEKPAKEPWEVRSCRRKIEKLQRICRNIDQKKKFKLSEYDLDEYGL